MPIEKLNLIEIVNLTSEKDDDSNYNSISKSDSNSVFDTNSDSKSDINSDSKSDSNTNNSSQKVFQLNIMVLLILLLNHF